MSVGVARDRRRSGPTAVGGDRVELRLLRGFGVVHQGEAVGLPLGAQSCEDVDRPTQTLSGDFLPDWSDDWVLLERERFRQLRLHALEALCEQLTQAGRFGQAVDAGLAAVAGEPLRESAHRAVIKAYLAEGNRGEALRQYERYRRLAHTELRVAPSAGMRALFTEPAIPLRRAAGFGGRGG